MDWDVVVVFSSLVLVLLGGFFFNYLNRRSVAAEVRLIIDKMGVSDPALTVELLQQLRRPSSDLRRGGLLVALGVAFAVFTLILDQPLALRPMLGAACFPTLIGLTYILFHYQARRGPKPPAA